MTSGRRRTAHTSQHGQTVVDTEFSGSVGGVARLVAVLAWIAGSTFAVLAVGLPVVAWLSMGGADLFGAVVAISVGLIVAAGGAMVFGRHLWRSGSALG